MIPLTEMLTDFGGVILFILSVFFATAVALGGISLVEMVFPELGRTLHTKAATAVTGGIGISCFVFTAKLIVRADPKTINMIAGTVVIVMMAIVFFILKNKLLRLYAVAEITFSLGVAIRTMSELGAEITGFQSLTIFSAVYLLIRGMDNFKKDLDERKKLRTTVEAALA
jgi:hypothetical protein